MNKQAVLIVNTKSRTGRKHFRAASQELVRRGVNLTQTHAVNNPAHLTELVSRVIAQGTPLVIIGGGDGTLSSVVPCFVGSHSVYGVLPLGTGNQFARDLGISTQLEAACDVLAEGKIGCVDLGIVNGKYFLNVATIGLTTLIADSLTTSAKRRFGRAVYFVALARALAKVRPFDLTLTIDPPPAGDQGTAAKAAVAAPASETGAESAGVEVEVEVEVEESAGADVQVRHIEMLKTLQIVIGNGRYHAGPFPLSPNATITDGRLVVYAISGVSRWALLKFALRLPGGHHVNLDQVPAFTVVQGSLVTKPSQRVTVDGEIALRTPLKFSVAAGALRVMVPQSFGDEPPT